MQQGAGPSPAEAQQSSEEHETARQIGAQRHERAMAGMEAAQGAQQPQTSGAGGGGPQVDDIATIVQQVGRLIDGLPPEIKQSLGIQLARGRSVADIASQIIQQMQQGAVR